MGERKVLNKYIPADFDPKLVPRGKKSKDDLVAVRMMLPFTIQCSTCSSFMYRGRKFNSKKEAVKGSEGKYLGIQRFRFYIKCTACSRPLTFLTDPQNADYEMESGGTRTYEVHKDRDKKNKEMEVEDAKMEKEDPMKALENRVLASQKEMADLDNLDEIKAMNMRHLKMMATIGAGIREAEASGLGTGMGMGNVADAAAAILRAKHGEVDEKDPLELDESDEALIKSIKFGQSQHQGSEKNKTISRLTDAEEEDFIQRRNVKLAQMEKQQMELAEKVKGAQTPISNSNGGIVSGGLNHPMIKVKRKRKKENEAPGGSSVSKVKKQMTQPTIQTKNALHSATATNNTTEKDSNALGLLAAYSDSDSG